jgi:hypothetical protein
VRVWNTQTGECRHGLEGHSDVVKKYSIEREYDPDLIQTHADMLQKAIASSDLSALQYRLRTGLSRDLGAMNSLRLYKHSWFGTKFLIDDYINTVLEAIEAFSDLTIRYNIPNAEVRFYQQSLEGSLKFFGRSALTLSGGAPLGMKHIGVVKTLWEAELLPEVISGASAGSIVAAIVGTSTDEHMYEVLEQFPYSDLAVFDPPGTTSMGWLSQRVRTFLRSGAFFEMDNIKRFEEFLSGESDTTGGFITLGSRMISHEFLTRKTGPSQLSEALSRLRQEPGDEIRGHIVACGRVARNTSDTALNQAWRKTLTHISIGHVWDANATLEEQQAIQANVTQGEVAILKSLEPGKMGAYLNEADANEVDFQTSFWGENYNRLYEVKQKWDVDGLFITRRGVGSEDWDDGGLCRIR